MISLGKTERCVGWAKAEACDVWPGPIEGIVLVLHHPASAPTRPRTSPAAVSISGTDSSPAGLPSDPFAQQLLPEIIRQRCRPAALAMIPATARLLVVLLPLPKPLDVERQVLELRAPRRARVLQLPPEK
jgi:hypothetical protein